MAIRSKQRLRGISAFAIIGQSKRYLVRALGCYVVLCAVRVGVGGAWI